MGGVPTRQSGESRYKRNLNVGSLTFSQYKPVETESGTIYVPPDAAAVRQRPDQPSQPPDQVTIENEIKEVKRTSQKSNSSGGDSDAAYQQPIHLIKERKSDNSKSDADVKAHGETQKSGQDPYEVFSDDGDVLKFPPTMTSDETGLFLPEESKKNIIARWLASNARKPVLEKSVSADGNPYTEKSEPKRKWSEVLDLLKAKNAEKGEANVIEEGDAEAGAPLSVPGEQIPVEVKIDGEPAVVADVPDNVRKEEPKRSINFMSFLPVGKVKATKQESSVDVEISTIGAEFGSEAEDGKSKKPKIFVNWFRPPKSDVDADSESSSPDDFARDFGGEPKKKKKRFKHAFTAVVADVPDDVRKEEPKRSINLMSFLPVGKVKATKQESSVDVEINTIGAEFGSEAEDGKSKKPKIFVNWFRPPKSDVEADSESSSPDDFARDFGGEPKKKKKRFKHAFRSQKPAKADQPDDAGTGKNMWDSTKKAMNFGKWLSTSKPASKQEGVQEEVKEMQQSEDRELEDKLLEFEVPVKLIRFAPLDTECRNEPRPDSERDLICFNETQESANLKEESSLQKVADDSNALVDNNQNQVDGSEKKTKGLKSIFGSRSLSEPKKKREKPGKDHAASDTEFELWNFRKKKVKYVVNKKPPEVSPNENDPELEEKNNDLLDEPGKEKDKSSRKLMSIFGSRSWTEPKEKTIHEVDSERDFMSDSELHKVGKKQKVRMSRFFIRRKEDSSKENLLADAVEGDVGKTNDSSIRPDAAEEIVGATAKQDDAEKEKARPSLKTISDRIWGKPRERQAVDVTSDSEAEKSDSGPKKHSRGFRKLFHNERTEKETGDTEPEENSKNVTEAPAEKVEILEKEKNAASKEQENQKERPEKKKLGMIFGSRSLSEPKGKSARKVNENKEVLSGTEGGKVKSGHKEPSRGFRKLFLPEKTEKEPQDSEAEDENNVTKATSEETNVDNFETEVPETESNATSKEQGNEKERPEKMKLGMIFGSRSLSEPKGKSARKVNEKNEVLSDQEDGKVKSGRKERSSSLGKLFRASKSEKKYKEPKTCSLPTEESGAMTVPDEEEKGEATTDDEQKAEAQKNKSGFRLKNIFDPQKEHKVKKEDDGEDKPPEVKRPSAGGKLKSVLHGFKKSHHDDEQKEGESTEGETDGETEEKNRFSKLKKLFKQRSKVEDDVAASPNKEEMETQEPEELLSSNDASKSSSEEATEDGEVGKSSSAADQDSTDPEPEPQPGKTTEKKGIKKPDEPPPPPPPALPPPLPSSPPPPLEICAEPVLTKVKVLDHTESTSENAVEDSKEPDEETIDTNQSSIESEESKEASGREDTSTTNTTDDSSRSAGDSIQSDDVKPADRRSWHIIAEGENVDIINMEAKRDSRLKSSMKRGNKKKNKSRPVSFADKVETVEIPSDTESADHGADKSSVSKLTNEKQSKKPKFLGGVLDNFMKKNRDKVSDNEATRAASLESNRTPEQLPLDGTKTEGIVYAELDMARSQGSVMRRDDDKTEYAEIIHPKDLRQGKDELRKSRENLTGSREHLTDPEEPTSDGSKEAAV